VPARRAPTRYAELVCRTNFSFLRGASSPDELVETAAGLGLHALGVTDRHTLAGVVRAHEAAKEHGLKLLIGAEILPADGPPIALYAMNRAGYGRLARLLTIGKLRATKGECELTVADVAAHAQDLIAVVLEGQKGVRESGGQEVSNRKRGADIRAVGDSPELSCVSALSLTASLPHSLTPFCFREAFGDRLYLGASIHAGGADRRRVAARAELSRATGIPLVAVNDVHYHERGRRFLQDVLVCIREHCTIAQAGRRLFPNGERHVKPAEDMVRLFHEHPAAVARSVEIAGRCTFSLDELRYEYPRELSPPGVTVFDYLTRLTWQGARGRYPDGVPDRIRRLIEHELDLIKELEYEPYFLTVWDLVRFARSRGILCQGRGSAANSAVCYCLGVTSVDPDRIDLLFERFVSRERNEPPDIDIDFEHERREEVFQYIYQKYGRDRAGIVAEVITYRPRSAVRDVGKALGLSLDRVDLLAKKLEWWGDGPLPDEALKEAGLNTDEYTVRCLRTLVTQIQGFPRHLSQHVGGFVMTRGPLDEMVPIGNTAMPGRTFIEWDKDDIDALGILKVDCLALGMLTALQKCFNLLKKGVRESGWKKGVRESGSQGVREEKREGESGSGVSSLTPSLPHSLIPCDRRGVKEEQKDRDNLSEASSLTPLFPYSLTPFCLTDIPAEDPVVYDMICRADTVGVFQIESRAQMSMLPRLRPRNFYDLVIEVAIVRPGPIQGGMVHPYLRRRNGQEPVVYPNDAIKEVLHKTMGVPLFQEQAMRLAVVAAGFTPGEADQLRRAMAAWRRSGSIEKFRVKLLEGMKKNGLPEVFAERVFEQIRGFGDYGFPESHAASFALLVYASAWLKLYYPAAFCAAILNSQPMGFYAPAQLVRDAREHGVDVRPIDVNASEHDCTLQEAGSEGVRESGSEENEEGENAGEPRDSCRSAGRSARAEAPASLRLRSAHDVVASAEFGRTYDDGAFATKPRQDNPNRDRKGAAPSACRCSVSKPTSVLPHCLTLLEKVQPFPDSPQPDASDGGAAAAQGPLPYGRGSDCVALRLGFRLIKGMSESKVEGVVRGRRDGPYRNVADLALRSGASRAVLARLAAAGACASMGISRRQAVWDVLSLADDLPLFAGLGPHEDGARLPPVTLEDEVLSDYDHTGLSLTAHPIGLLRQPLAAARVIPNRQLRDAPHGRMVRVSGLVLVRQRPGTAKGITFVTLEDETGIANLVIRPNVYDRHRRVARGATGLIATGKVERQGDVIHVSVSKLEDVACALAKATPQRADPGRPKFGPLPEKPRSRDFR